MGNKPIISAETIDKSFYKDERIFEAVKENIFCKTWQYIGDAQLIARDNANVFPVTLLEKCLDEPLLLIENNGEIKCLTNVCTHRAFQLIQYPAKTKRIVCAYHGRRFNLDGGMEHMPMFEEAKDFPRPCDDLHKLEIKYWKRFLFTGIDPKLDFEAVSMRLDKRIGHMDMERWRYAPEYSKVYTIKANWALYIDNYLEGFHIPFVHDSLSNIIDFGNYTTETYDNIVLQIGYGKSGDPALNLPEGHIDFGKNVTAYYYWLYPNFMLNIYNWGVQINIVKPMGPHFCKVEFEYYIADEELWQQFGKDELAEKTEREDEFVIEAVQKGLNSRFYKNGRYSPKMENGVYYFHEILKSQLGNIDL